MCNCSLFLRRVAMNTRFTLMRNESTLRYRHPLFSLRGRGCTGFCFSRNYLYDSRCCGLVVRVKASASRKNEKKLRNGGNNSKTKTLPSIKFPAEERENTSGSLPTSDAEPFSVKSGESSPITTAARSSVLQACITTSGLLLAFGVLIRQASHIASMEGWGVLDASTEVSFGYEMWHIELIVGLVVLITSSRYVLLKAWPDFAESSEAANRQVLSSLQPLDFVIVAFLPGISEELLFRGGLLPLCGLTWTNALVIGAIFGVLHLGSGRRYSFAVWATFVGFAYGLATIISSSVIVPVVSHSLNNLLGAILWSYASNLQEKK